MNIDPDSIPSPQPGEEATWDEADEAMHRLLKAVFDAGEANVVDRPARYLLPFLPGPTSDQASRDSAELSIGETLGRFRIEGELGRGGFGIVYRATDTHLGRPVALKVPRPDKVQSLALWDRFAREARLAASLNDEAIVGVLDAGVLDGHFVIVSDYQEGESLSRWLAARYPLGMPPKLAATTLLRLASGLRHAHDHGVLHRDLKPANVLMVASPETPGGWSPRITDFGLGTFHEEIEAATLTGFWQGSPPYMAPEQVLPNMGRLDERTDLYALGATFYEMLTGRSIYPCKSMVELSLILSRGEPTIRPRALRSSLSVDLETICLKCLEHDPGRRYPSAAELLADLARFLDGRPIRARPLPVWGRLGRWARRRPSHAALIVLALTATAIPAGLIVRHEWRLKAKNAELTRSLDQLRSTVIERDSANIELRSTLDRLRASDRYGRRSALAARLNLASRELASGRVEVVQTLLRSYETSTAEDDLRDFAWHHLMREATRNYTVRPLKDLRWWRGTRPIAPTLEGLGRSAREGVHKGLVDLLFDPDGIHTSYRSGSFLLGDDYFGFTSLSDRGDERAPLRVDDGLRLAPTGLPGLWQAIGPGGRTLALSGDNWGTKEDEAPPIVRLPDLTVSAGGQARSPKKTSSLRVVQVPTSHDLCFSGDGGTLACLSSFPTVDSFLLRPLIYDLNSEWRASYPQFVRSIVRKLPNARGVRTIILLSRDGSLAAVTDDNPRVLVFETRTGRPLWSITPEAMGSDGLVTTLAFSPDGKSLVTGDSNGLVRDWDSKTGKAIGEFPSNVGFVAKVGHHPDSETIAIIADNEDAIRLWNRAPRHDLPTILDHGDEIWGLTFADSGRTLISAGNDDQVQAWDVASGSILGRLKGEILQSAVAVAGPGEGQPLAFADYDGVVNVHSTDLANGPSLFRFDHLKGKRLRALAWSPDAKYLVASGNDPRLLVATWEGNAPTSRIIETPYLENYGLAFAPDGKALAIGCHDQLISIRAVPGFHRRATLAARAPVSCVAFSPDGKTLVSGDSEGGLQFWNAAEETLRETRERVSDKGGVWTLAFSPDGKTLAIGGDDGVVRLWDPELAIERLALTGHEAKVHALAFSPDGKTLASGDFAGKIRLWHAGP
ncbi:protein kinase domain-containing protein [Tundrisphaera lichenicola]|uniref:protein kinase domain-containing protein n=1 Tax=Tundrisphaera lichenicola TaxID=2029860 RepID=UPI003EC0AEA0